MSLAPSPSLEDCYRRYFPLIREKCRRMLRDSEAAQDVAQETLVRFWQAGAPSEPRAATAWLYKTSTRLAIDYLRRRKFEVAGEVPDRAASAPGPETLLRTRQTLALLSRRLSTRDLEVALLARVDGLTQPEVAAVLSLSDRTVRRVLDRIDGQLEGLKEELA